MMHGHKQRYERDIRERDSGLRERGLQLPRPVAVPRTMDGRRRAVWQSLGWAAILAAAWLGVMAAVPAAEPSAKEQELLAILAGEGDEAAKALTCKQLAIHGSAASVDALAALLPNERLSSWARIALEAIPGPEADAALRRSLAVLRGSSLVGVINTLGIRGDEQAVPLLLTRLSGEDDEIAAAAAAALGRIGGESALAGLQARLTTTGEVRREMAAEACVAAAAAMLAAGGDSTRARELADAVREAEVSEQRKAEALRLAILARGPEAAQLLTESFWLPSKRLFGMAVTTARELPRGDAFRWVDEATVAGVEGLLAGKGPDSRAAVLLDVLGERRSGSAVPAVLKLVMEGAPPMRLAAVKAAGAIGDVAVIEPLLAVVADADASMSAAAREAIIGLEGEAINEALLARLASDNPAVLVGVAEAIGARRLAVADKLLPLLDHGDEGVRVAVLRSLGRVGDLDTVEVIITRLGPPASEAEAEAARLALLEAAVRMPDRETCAERIASAMAAAAAATKKDVVLLETLAAVGGARALAAVEQAAASESRLLADAATRLLGSWMTADAAPVLLALAKQSDGAFRGRALRGYLRIARQFAVPDDERAAMCRAALAAAANDDERKLVVEILPRHPSAQMLEVAREAEKMPGLAEAAKAAASAIEEKLAAQAG